VGSSPTRPTARNRRSEAGFAFISHGHGGLTRIVITGASGNVGSALLRRLTATSDYAIVGPARRLPDDGPGGDRVRWTSVDLSKEASVGVLRDAFRGAPSG
jgi:nucleoside-diphosphate-sugar epimerase